MADVLLDIVGAIGAVFIGLYAWVVITGRHQRYYDNHRKRPAWVPLELHPSRKNDRRISK